MMELEDSSYYDTNIYSEEKHANFKSNSKYIWKNKLSPIYKRIKNLINRYYHSSTIHLRWINMYKKYIYTWKYLWIIQLKIPLKYLWIPLKLSFISRYKGTFLVLLKVSKDLGNPGCHSFKKLWRKKVKEWRKLKYMQNNWCHRKYIWIWFNLDTISTELIHEWRV